MHAFSHPDEVGREAEEAGLVPEIFRTGEYAPVIILRRPGTTGPQPAG
jgi:hypothetical protein